MEYVGPGSGEPILREPPPRPHAHKRDEDALAVAALAAALLLPSFAADAHLTTWHWAESAAEAEVNNYYSDILEVACYGRGRSIRGKGSRRLYRHFDCTVALSDGSESEFILHVRGLKRFSTSNWR
jgi:hypothetical protein